MNDSGVHRIRLKGPWQILPPQSEGQDFERYSMPQTWRSLFGDVAGIATFRRNFHTPSRLDEHERVPIHIPSGVGELNDFTINGTAINPFSIDPMIFDVTQHLQDFNLIEFTLSFDPSKQPDIPGGLWETVFVEIHSERMTT